MSTTRYLLPGAFLVIFALAAAPTGCERKPVTAAPTATAPVPPAPPAKQPEARAWQGNIDTIKAGMTLAELRSALPRSMDEGDLVRLRPTRHHFTIARDAHEVMALTGDTHAFMWYYFVFVDGKLDKIVQDDAAVNGTGDTEPKTMKALEQALVERPAVPFDQFPMRVRQHAQQYKAEVAKLVKEFARQKISSADPAEQSYHALMKRFDATRIRLGDSVQSVGALFGEAVNTEEKDGFQLRTYGGDSKVEGYFPPRVRVYFKDGVVAKVQTTYIDYRGNEYL